MKENKKGKKKINKNKREEEICILVNETTRITSRVSRTGALCHSREKKKRKKAKGRKRCIKKDRERERKRWKNLLKREIRDDT